MFENLKNILTKNTDKTVENKIDYAILGLGNPGEKYSHSRHNIGFMVLSHLAKKHNLTFKKVSKGKFLGAELKIANKNILLAFPLTFMNLSGVSAKYISARYKLKPEQIAIVVDEYNFPLGKVHLRIGGSDGGHNGVSSLIEELGTKDFLRFRCGIDRNFEMGGLVDYVLSDFDENEMEQLNEMTEKCTKAIEHFIINDLLKARSEINSWE
jgi:peptidyl-tRNA hydrolase, PTH1 family